MESVSVFSNDIVNSFREAGIYLKKTLRERGVDKVAVWGCGETGEVLMQLLKTQGFTVAAVYDSYRQGEFCGHSIRNPHRSLLPDVPVIIASSKAVEELRGISDFLEKMGIRYFFTDVRKPQEVPLARFRNIHRGKRCFIVGNGPSLNRIDMGRLSGEIILGSNRVYYGFPKWGLHFTYWSIEDRLVAEDIREEWNRMEGPIKFIPWDLMDLVSNHINVVPVRFLRKPFRTERPRFSDTPEFLYWGGTVTYLLFQVAAIMGCNPIYLVGVDFHYVRPDHVQELEQPQEWISQGDDPNHFFPEYFGKGRKWHDPDLDRAHKCYEAAESYFRSRKIHVYNATPGSRLDVFERIEFDTLFA
jgi:hypothetical protein